MPKQYGTPGPRAIYPSVATSQRLSRCSVEAQLLFERLIAAADDQGRLPGHPDLVKADCMPLVRAATAETIEAWLQELASVGLVIRYDARDEHLLQLRGWWDHQDGQRHIYRSRWPAPDGWTDRLRGHGERSGGPSAAESRPQSAEGGRSSADAGGGAETFTGGGAAALNGGPPMERVLRKTNLYDAYRELTGSDCDARCEKWIDDLCGKFDRTDVSRALYDDPDPRAGSLLGRVTHRLRNGHVVRHA